MAINFAVYTARGLITIVILSSLVSQSESAPIKKQISVAPSKISECSCQVKWKNSEAQINQTVHEELIQLYKENGYLHYSDIVNVYTPTCRTDPNPCEFQEIQCFKPHHKAWTSACLENTELCWCANSTTGIPKIANFQIREKITNCNLLQSCSINGTEYPHGTALSAVLTTDGCARNCYCKNGTTRCGTKSSTCDLTETDLLLFRLNWIKAMYLHQYYNTQDVRPCQHFQNVTDQLAINNKNNLTESLWNSVSIASRYIFKNKFLGSQVVRYVDCITDSDRISSSFLYDIIKGNDSHKIDRNQWNAFFDESTNLTDYVERANNIVVHSGSGPSR